MKIETTDNEAIVATGLTKWFGEGEAKVTAVNQVGLVAHFGEMLFIVGPSGSGKTTMLSMISGILRPNAGNVKVKGADIWTLNKPVSNPFDSAIYANGMIESDLPSGENINIFPQVFHVGRVEIRQMLRPVRNKPTCYSICVLMSKSANPNTFPRNVFW